MEAVWNIRLDAGPYPMDLVRRATGGPAGAAGRSRAEGYIVIPVTTDTIEEGEEVTVILFG